MKCFIASAFEKDDVDSVYENCIIHTLKKLSIKPLRVDRVEHNDDIDNKIIELINWADIVIADLTYARPSVYYEAGYAAGLGKPVLYIARGDHFRPKDNDPEGLLRVHFDLQMKNIISWLKPNETFSKRLENRLKHVLKPLKIQLKVNEKLNIERAEFNKQPESSKVKILRDKANFFLKTRAFKLLKSESDRGIDSSEILVIREGKKVNQKIAVVCTPSAVKGIFDGISFRWQFGDIGPNRNNIPLHFHYVVASLRSVPSSRVKQALSSFSLLSDGTMHCHHDSERTSGADVFVHVISGIHSLSEFAKDFRSILVRYNLGKVT